MSEKNEFVDGLKSNLKDKVAALSAIQADAKGTLSRLDEARKSGIAGDVETASNEFEAKGELIREALKSVNETKEQIGLFTEIEIEESPSAKSNVSRDELKSLFEQYKSTSKGQPDISIGEHFVNILKRHGRLSGDAVKNGNTISLMAQIGKDDLEVFNEIKSIQNVKSIYTNNGVELLDGATPVPGHVGYQCGLVEDPYVCPLTLPPDEFEDCLTVKTLKGNRLRYTRMVSRDDNAGVVLETVYNPYPTLEQDGTKPEGVFTLASAEAAAVKIAEFVVASDEVLEDCPSVASLINDFIITGIEAKKRQQLINGTGTNQMRGLLNQPDILTRVHRAGTGVAGDNIWDTFRRALTDLWIQGADINDACVIMNPLDVEIIDLMKDDEGRYLFSTDNSDCINRRLRCLNVKQASSIAAGTAVIGSLKNNWMLYVRKALEIRMGYTGDQFITNTNTILGEMRALTILRCPQHVERITGIAI